LDLGEYGYSQRIEEMYAGAKAAEGFVCARVLADYGLGFVIVAEAGEMDAVMSGGMLADVSGIRPVAGDWVVARSAPEGGHAQITGVLPRFSCLERADTMVGWKKTVVAANFDYLIIMISMNANYGLNRIERMLSAARASGGVPVLALSKADLCADSAKLAGRAEAVAAGVDVITFSSVTGEGMAKIMSYFRKGVTCAVVGSSGVGKSTLLNRLMGYEAAKTATVRQEDSKGRHTTTYRALHLLPEGGLFLDTPGIRAFGLTAEGDELDSTFTDIKELASSCRFGDCSHTKEPGCAVLKAIEEGELEERRYLSYMRMAKELDYVRASYDRAVWQERKKKGKAIAKFSKELNKTKGK